MTEENNTEYRGYLRTFREWLTRWLLRQFLLQRPFLKLYAWCLLFLFLLSIPILVSRARGRVILMISSEQDLNSCYSSCKDLHDGVNSVSNAILLLFFWYSTSSLCICVLILCTCGAYMMLEIFEDDAIGDVVKLIMESRD